MNKSIKAHCERVYAEFQKGATLEGGVLVWKGKSSELLAELKVPSGYYGRVMRQLEYMGCLTRRHRGSLGVPSEIELHRDPSSIKEWVDAPSKDLTGLPEYATLAQTVKDIETLVGGIDIREALRDLDTRLSVIERKTKQQ